MTKYRIQVSIDGKNFFWVVVDQGRFIRNPTKEDRIGTKLYHYNKTNICPMCREEYERDGIELTDKSILYPGCAKRNIDKKGETTDDYVCGKHWSRSYQKYNLNSRSNVVYKALADRRMGNLDSNSSQMKGDNFEKITDIWLEPENLNKKNDNYNFSYDHGPIIKHILVKIGDKTIDLYGKIPQTKGRFYNSINRRYDFGNLVKDRDKIFDIYILYCASEDGKTIERIYIIPIEEIKYKRKGITITMNPKDRWGNLIYSWYDKYRVMDVDIFSIVNKINKEMN